jgi:hypothetical protein
MKGSFWVIAALTAMTLVAFGQGCDGTPSVDTSQNEVTVTGVVKVKGQPATGGQISFNPSNRDRKVPAFSAPIGQDGSFTIKTYSGENEVRFTGEVAKDYPALGMIKKYCTVTGGGQRQDFDLLGDDQSAQVSAKSKMMSKAAAKAGSGRRP